MAISKSVSLCGIVLFCLLGNLLDPGQAHGRAARDRQSCEGTIALDSDGMLLLADIKKNPSLWCDAYIGDDKNSAIAHQVLAKCPVGSRCIIDGLFAGHGVFYWTKVTSVKRKGSVSSQ